MNELLKMQDADTQSHSKGPAKDSHPTPKGVQETQRH
jgi:hypothetical protein